jgi:hypothetical protein
MGQEAIVFNGQIFPTAPPLQLEKPDPYDNTD